MLQLTSTSRFERDEISLLGHGMVLVNVVGLLKVLGGVVFSVRATWFGLRFRRHTGLAQASRMLDMGKPTPIDIASTLVSKIWALECVPVSTLVTLLTVAQAREGFAYWCVFAHMDVSISAVVFVAMIILKVDTVGRSVRGRLMRERAGAAFRAVSLEEKLPTDGCLIGVVDVGAS
jgi:hypothetical protein